MAKKILLVSPVPTHPQDAGNRARVYQLVSAMRKEGHDLHFLHLRAEDGDPARMRQCWGTRYYALPFTRPDPGTLRKIRHVIGWRQPFRIDDWYATSLDEFLPKLLSKISFDVVMVEYAFLSGCLRFFDESVLKIIDTIDVFSDRHESMKKHGLQPSWFSTTRAEEAIGLSRADVVIAISEEDRRFFSGLIDRKIITVGHIVPLGEPRGNSAAMKGILFVGSANPSNVQAVRHFVNETFPKVRQEYADVQFFVAGKVCNQLKDCEGCVKLGVVDDLKQVYAEARVVINPMLFGTGLAIKTIEALGHAKPVVTTSVGARGLIEGRDRAFLVADTPEEFCSAITRLLSDEAYSDRLARSAHEFAIQWNERNIRPLLNSLETWS